MGKGSSGKKEGGAAKRNRAMYKATDRYNTNKRKKEHKEQKKQAKLYYFGKGIYKDTHIAEVPKIVLGYLKEYAKIRLEAGHALRT